MSRVRVGLTVRNSAVCELVQAICPCTHRSCLFNFRVTLGSLTVHAWQPCREQRVAYRTAWAWCPSEFAQSSGALRGLRCLSIVVFHMKSRRGLQFSLDEDRENTHPTAVHGRFLRRAHQFPRRGTFVTSDRSLICPGSSDFTRKSAWELTTHREKHTRNQRESVKN